MVWINKLKTNLELQYREEFSHQKSHHDLFIH